MCKCLLYKKSLYLRLLLTIMTETKNLSSKKRKSTKFIVTKSRTILFSLRYSKCSWNIPKNFLPSNLWFYKSNRQSVMLSVHSLFFWTRIFKSSFLCALLCAQNIRSQKVCLSPLKKLTRIAQGMTQVPSVAYLIITFVVLVK